MILKIAITALIGYLLGSINTSIIVGKLHGVDIRKHGSGNAGTTNTLRTLGAGAALMTFMGDLLKGVAACLIGRWMFGWVIDPSFDQSMNGFFTANAEFGLILAGVFAIFGHNWPIYFGFKGGKGVLTTFSVILMMDWKLALALLTMFIVIVAFTRYVSLGSVLGAAALPFLTVTPWFWHDGWVFLLATSIISLILIIKHGANIARVLKGTESKLSFKKKGVAK